MGHLFWPVVNFSVLVGILVYFLREPFKLFVAGRSVRLGKDIAEASSKLDSAQSELAEVRAKLQAIDGELEQMRSQAEQDAESMKTKIVSSAKRQSLNLLDDARRASRNLFSDLKRELLIELLDQAFSEIEALLPERLNQLERKRLSSKFSEQLRKA